MMAAIEKSSRDPREYKQILLSNNLKVILVSDPDTDISAASINVHVGSAFEPIPGLAHYLEHMLFMGTKKYPKENEFSNYLSENAGESNAFTDHEDTNFYYRVSSDQLSESLDIFSQFFISPLFNESSLERELKSIDSEFDKNLLDDQWRFQQVLYLYFDHPVNHFSLGNSSTLNVPDIRSKIIEFYEGLYSSNCMSLVVCGNESLDELEEMVQIFREIPERNLNRNTEEVKCGCLRAPGITRVVPVKDTRSIKFVWKVQSCSQYYETKPDGYLGHLLGHEGEGSILSLLKYLNLAEELFSYYNEEFSFCSFFTVEIKLTQKGLELYQDIIEVVFAYLNMLKKEGPKLFVFEELKKVAYSEFLFKNKKDPYTFVQKLSSRMAKYPAEKVLTGPELYFKYDEEVISQITDSLNLNNLQIFLVSKTWNTQQMAQEPFFGTYYLYEEIGENLRERILNPRDLALSLPKPNPYISDTSGVEKEDSSKFPEKICQNEKFLLYFKKDSKFLVDKIYGQVVIHCNSFDFDSNPYMFMCAKLWEKLLCEKIREETYLASIAGQSHDIEVDNHGIRLSLNGFSDKYFVFLRYLFEKISVFQPEFSDSKVFDDLKNELMNSIANCYFSKPTTQIQRVIYEITLVGGYYTQLEKLKALNGITIQDLIWYSKKWLKNVYLIWIVMGNITKSAALDLVESCTNQVFSAKSAKGLTKDDFLQLRVMKIPKKSSSLFLLPLTDTQNTNSAIISLFQIGPEEEETGSLACLLENYLEEPFFDEVRTKAQMGYIVSSYAHKIRGVYHFIFMVQSSSHSPQEVYQKISCFISQQITEISKLSDKKFKKLQKSAEETALEKDLSLYDEFKRFRHEIDSASFQFDRKQTMKKNLRNLTKEKFLSFVNRVFVDEDRRLDICLVSRNMEDSFTEQRKTFKGLKEFKRAHTAWSQVFGYSSVFS